MFHRSTITNETYLLLKELFSHPEIKEQFALAGGTALALQTGHRISIDLDIFSHKSFNTREIEILLRSEKKFQFDFVNRTERMLFAYINKIKCDFILEPATLIQPFIEEDGINYFHIQDIAAMKMHTVCGRGKKKDFFDIYVLLELYDWSKMLEWFEKKYGSNQFYYLWRSINYFIDADEDTDIEALPPYNQSWEEIKEIIIEKTSQ